MTIKKPTTTREVAANIRFLYHSIRRLPDDAEVPEVTLTGLTAGEELLKAGGKHDLVELLRLEHATLSLLDRQRTMIREELAR